MSAPTKKKFKDLIPRLKSIFSGIGTGAGVAWPLFGLVSSSLSFGIGGLTTIGLGSLCSAIFLTVGIPVFWITYHNSKKKKKQLENKLLTAMDEVLKQLKNHYEKNNPNFNLSDFKSYLQKLVKQPRDSNDEFSLLLIQLLLDHYSSFISDKQWSFSKRNSKYFMQALVQTTPFSAPPTKELLSTFFLNFAGIFGSIAGCSSGVMGLLVSLGVASGFQAMPFIGMAVLIVAVSVGLVMAIKSVHSELETRQKKAMYKNIKNFQQEISQQNFAPQNTSAGKITTNDREQNKSGLKRKLKRHSLPGPDWIRLSLLYSYKEDRNKGLSKPELIQEFTNTARFRT